MLKLLILISLWVWYSLVFTTINKKESPDKILYILFTTFVFLLFFFVAAVLGLSVVSVILFIIFLVIVYWIHTDFVFLTFVKEYFLKLKKVEKIELWVREPMSKIVKKNIKEIKWTMHSIADYKYLVFDVTICLIGFVYILFFVFNMR